MPDAPFLSIVITSYTMERLKDVLELLDSIRVQTYRNLETIVVVEKSKDLLRRVEEYAAENRNPPVRVVFNTGEQGLSAARNVGTKEAKGDIIAFVDDDAVVVTDWAEEMVKTYEDDSIIGVTGAISPLWQDGKVDWFPSEFDWILSCSGFAGSDRLRDVRNVFGANMSFRREGFDRAGLFSPHLGAKGGGATGKHELVGDETELSIRIRQKTGKRIVFNPKAAVGHKVYGFRITPGFVARRAYWEGYTKAMFRQVFVDHDRQHRVLNVEHDLLRRISRRLIPGILVGFMIRPSVSWRRMWLTVNALLFVAIGYSSFETRHIMGRERTAAQLQEL